MNSLKEIQVNVAIEDVIAICKPQNKFNFNEAEEKMKEIKKKEKNIEDWENLTKITDGDSGFTAKIIRKVLEGLVISIKNIQLRYEDKNDFIGVSVNEVMFKNAPNQPENTIRKQAIVKGVNVFAGQKEENGKIVINNKNSITNINEIILDIDFIQKHYKQIKVHLNAPALKMDLTRDQYVEFMSLMGRLSEYSQAMKYLGIRPQDNKVIGNEKQWWKYAAFAIKKREDEKKKTKVIRNDVIAKVEKDYTENYITWRKKNNKKYYDKLKKYDDEMTEDEIKFLRKKILGEMIKNTKGRMNGKKLYGMSDAEIALLDKLVTETETIDDQEEVFSLDLKFDSVQIDLKDSSKDKTLCGIIATGINVKCILYGKGFHVEVNCNNAMVQENMTCFHDVLVKKQKDIPLLKVSIDQSPNLQDIKIKVNVSGTEITINKMLLMNAYQFFIIPDEINMLQLKTFLEEQLSKFYQLATMKVETMKYEGNTKVNIDVKVNAPTIVVPLFFDKKDSQCIQVKLGNIDVKSKELKEGQGFLAYLKNVCVATFTSFKNINDDSKANYFIQNFSGEVGIDIGKPNEPFIDVNAIIEPFKAKLSKAKMDLLQAYIKEYSDGWKEIMFESSEIETETDEDTLNDIELMKQQKNMISKIFKKASSEAVRVNVELKQFLFEVAKIGDYEEKTLITKLVIEEVKIGCGVKINGMEGKISIGKIQLFDHVNEQSSYQYIFTTDLNKNEGCVINLNASWELGLIKVNGDITIGDLTLNLQPKVIGELIKYVMSLMFSYELDNRTQEQKRLTMKKSMLVDVFSSKEIEKDISKEEMNENKTELIPVDNTPNKEKGSIESILEEFEMKLEIDFKVKVEKCGVLLIEDNDMKAIDLNVKTINCGLQLKNNSPIFDLTIENAGISEVQMINEKEVYQKVLVYNGEQLFSLHFDMDKLELIQKQFSLLNVNMKLGKIYCYICPSLISRFIRMISSESLISSIDIEEIRKQIVDGMSSLSKHSKEIIKNIAIKQRQSSDDLSLFKLDIELQSPEINVVSQYSSSNEFNDSLKASIGVIKITSNYELIEEKSTVNQIIKASINNINVFTIQQNEELSIIKDLSLLATVGNEMTINKEEIFTKTIIKCSIENPLLVNIDARQIQFILNYVVIIKNQIDMASLDNLLKNISKTREKRGKDIEKKLKEKKELKKQQTDRIIFDLSLSINSIGLMIKNIGDLALIQIKTIGVDFITKENTEFDLKCIVNDILIEDKREQADGRYHQLLHKKGENPFIKLSLTKNEKQHNNCILSVGYPNIVIIPSLIADLMMVVLNIIPKELMESSEEVDKESIEKKVEEKIKNAIVKKKDGESIAIRELLKVIESVQPIPKEKRETRMKSQVFANVDKKDDTPIEYEFTGKRVFDALKYQMEKSDYEVMYICNELIRRRYLLSYHESHIFKFDYLYAITPMLPPEDEIMVLSSFEKGKDKEQKEKSKNPLFSIVFALEKLSFAFVIDDNNLDTPYLLFNGGVYGNFILSDKNDINVVLQTLNVELFSCKAKQGQLTYEGVQLNKGLDIVLKADVGLTDKFIDIDLNSDLKAGSFTLSFDDIKMVLGGVKCLMKTFENVQKKMEQFNPPKEKNKEIEEGKNNKKKEIMNLATIFNNPPSMRIGNKDLYVKGLFGLENFEFILNNPIINSPLYKLTVSRVGVDINGYNDDFTINLEPIISFNYYNSIYSAYENVIQHLGANMIVRFGCDMIKGKKRMFMVVNGGLFDDPAKRLNLTISQHLIKSFMDVYKELEVFSDVVRGVDDFKPLKIVNEFSSMERCQMIAIVNKDGYPLHPREVVEIPLGSYRNEMETFKLKIDQNIYIIPISTSIKQLHVLKNGDYFYSQMIYDENGGKVVYLRALKSIKNCLDIPISIRFLKVTQLLQNKSKGISIQPNETYNLFMDNLSDRIKVSFKNIEFDFDSDTIDGIGAKSISKNEKIRVDRTVIDHEYQGEKYKENIIEIKYPFVITNYFPFDITFQTNEIGLIKSKETKRTFAIPEKNVHVNLSKEMSCDVPMQQPLDNDIYFYDVQGRTQIRARWGNGQLILDSEFLIINKTGIEISACVGKKEILLPTDETITDLTIGSNSIKFKMDDGYSESIKAKALAEGDLCVNGKTKTFFIHLELSNDENYPGVKVITLTNSYYIINTLGDDLFVKNTDGNIIKLEKNLTNKPIPLILSKSSSKDIVPSFSLSFSELMWSKQISCIEGNNEEISILRDDMFTVDETETGKHHVSLDVHKSRDNKLSMSLESHSLTSSTIVKESKEIKENANLQQPKETNEENSEISEISEISENSDLDELDKTDTQKSVIVSVRKYGKNQCIVIEEATLDNCKFKIINDTKYTLSYNWIENEKSTEQSFEIKPNSQMKLKMLNDHKYENIYLTGEIIEEPMKISMKKVAYFGLLEIQPKPVAIYSNLINGTLVLTITDDHMKLLDECPLYHLDPYPLERKMKKKLEKQSVNNKKSIGKSSKKEQKETPENALKSSKMLSTSISRQLSNKSNIQINRIEKPIIQINFTIPSFGIDVIDQRRVELVYGRITNVNFNCSVFTSYTDIACNIDQIQLDNSDISTNEDVVLSINKTVNQPAVHMSMQIIQNSVSQTFFYIPFFTILIQPIIVGIESKLITMLYEFYQSLDLKFDSHKTELPEGIPSLNSKLDIFIRTLILQPIIIVISCNLQPNHLVVIPYNFFTAPIHAIGSTLINIKDSQIRLKATVAKNVNVNGSTFKQLFIEHYVNQVVSQLFLLVTNSSILGNPRGLIHDLSTGCHDLIYEPKQGISVGASSFGKGMVKGVSSLTQKATHGVSNSLSGFIGGVSNLVATFSFDKAYIEQRNADKRAANVGDGIRKGFKSFGKGIFEGVTGVVTQPIKGAMNDGVEGFFGGIGKGIFGFVTKPIVGTVDLVGKTIDGVRASTSSTSVERLRRVRPIDKEQSLHMYDHNESLLAEMMNEKGKGFIIHSYLPNVIEFWVLGENCFATYNPNNRKMEFHEYSSLRIKEKENELELRILVKVGQGKLLGLRKDTIKTMKFDKNNPRDMVFVKWCKKLIKLE